MNDKIKVGDIFGHLRVIEIVTNTEKRSSYLCQCVCIDKKGFRVTTMRYGIRYVIGIFSNLEEAVKARNDFFIKHGWKLPLDK